MNSTKTSRAEARTAQIEAIKKVSRRLITEKGLTGLSLREVAGEMGLVSSALYRYFATRDELLTALIFDAYNDLGTAVERADAKCTRTDTRARWYAVAIAIRKWAKKSPHEYALIYGTPVPNYEAPSLTIVAATRVPRVFGDLLAVDRQRGSSTRPKVKDQGDVRGFLEVANLASIMPGVQPEDYVRALMAWTHIFGFISFELFGHYVGSVRNTNKMYERVVEELADLLELTR